MTTHRQGNRLDPRSEAHAEFRIFIVADTAQAATRAFQVCSRIASRFDDGFTQSVAAQTFAELEKPAHFQQSLEAASHADMLFVVSDHALSTTSKS